jgi:hypothetical protein
VGPLYRTSTAWERPYQRPYLRPLPKAKIKRLDLPIGDLNEKQAEQQGAGG